MAANNRLDDGEQGKTTCADREVTRTGMEANNHKKVLVMLVAVKLVGSTFELQQVIGE